MSQMPAVPPVGTLTSDANAAMTMSAYADLLVQEETSRRNGTMLGIQSYADDNMQLFLGQADYSGPAVAEGFWLQANRIQTSIMSNTAVQTGTPPRIEFKPRETGEQPMYWINSKVKQSPEVMQCLQGIDPSAFTPDPQTGITRCLTNDEASAIQGRMQQIQQMAMQNPNAPGVDPDLLIAVNDETAADAMQDVFDSMWDASDAEFYTSECQLNNSIIGFAWMLYQWDDTEKRFNLIIPNWVHVHPDPVRTDVSKFAYLVYDQIVDAQEAKAAYPLLAAQIDAAATESPTIPGWSGQQSLSSPASPGPPPPAPLPSEVRSIGRVPGEITWFW